MGVLALLGLCLFAHAGSSDYRLGPGDVVKIDVFGETFGGTFNVSSAGAVDFPFCGLIHVGGKTTFEAAAALRECLLDGYLKDPQVSVNVAEFRSQAVEVLGGVEQPGTYYLEGDTTLRSLVAQAGGVQSEGSTGRVILSRADGTRTVLAVDELEGEAGSVLVAGGEVVTIEEGTVVYVGGEVAKPGAIGFVDGITVTQALMKAGGPTPVARLSGAYLLRGDDRISVNLKRMLRGKDSDFVMEPGDRLVIKESPL